jgi:hypothetical protein
MAETKVNLAIIDTDLTIRTLEKYPLSTNGRQIHVISGGENHFMPVISSTSYLEFPSRKKYFLFGSRMYKKIYFAMNKAKKCVDFNSGEVGMPSPEQLKVAIAATMLAKIGKEKQDITWISYVTLAITILLLLISMGVV